MTWRFGIIGCGRMGYAHARQLVADARAQVVTLFDPDSAAAIRIQRELAPQAEIVSTCDGLLARNNLDAVVICTPTTFHHPQVLAALARGLHVLCEKPLADSRTRIQELISAAEAACHLKTALAYQRRHWAVYRRMREEIASGRWGSIRAVTSINTERWQQTIGGTWRDDPQVNLGGFIGDAGSHKIDILFYVTGLKPTELQADSDHCGSRVEIVSSVIGRLEGGVPLTMSFVGHAHCFTESLCVHCEHADVAVRDNKLWIAQENRLSEIELPAPVGDPSQQPVHAFLEMLAGTPDNRAPFTCALPVFDFTQAVLQSSRNRHVAQPGVSLQS